MKKNQIIPGILVAVLAIAGYFFKDKLFTGGSIKTNPMMELSLLKSTIVIDSVTDEKVIFRVILEAKKDVEITALRSFYFDKRKTTRRNYDRKNSSSTTRTQSNEMGELDLSDGKIELKAGEKKEIAAYFMTSEVLDSHYLQITANADEACPPEMSTEDCIAKQMEQIGRDDKDRKIDILEKVKKQ